MKLRRLDASIDRQIITGLITCDPFIKEVKRIYKPDFLVTKFTVIVANWCFEYFDRYGKAPGKTIKDIFQSKQRDGLDETDAELIEDFLVGLSDDYERGDKFNWEYVLEQTEKLFRQRNLKFLAEDIDACLSSGDLDEAEAVLTDFKKVERPVEGGIKPLEDMDAYQKAFASRQEPLFKLPGAYGQMLNPHFVRGGFVSFLGRAKIGKTWRLIDIAHWALRDRCNVAMFQLGDLSEDDYIIREGVYFAKKSNDPRYCHEIFVPVLDCQKNQDGECPNRPRSAKTDKHQVCTKCSKNFDFEGAVWEVVRPKVDPLTWREAWRASQQWKKRHRTKGFYLSCRPRLTVNQICTQLDIWEEYDGFVPDVIILDYADLIRASDTRQERRHQEDEKWSSLRQMCHDRHILIVTATQTNRSGFDNSDTKVESISEDKRKLDHVTALFILNQNEQEEEQGIIRVANGIVREGKRDVTRQVCVLQSLQTGQPYVASFWRANANKKKGEE